MNSREKQSVFDKSLKDGLLPVECWCQADVLRITRREVATGLTRSCGRDGCEHPVFGKRARLASVA